LWRATSNRLETRHVLANKGQTHVVVMDAIPVVVREVEETSGATVVKLAGCFDFGIEARAQEFDSGQLMQVIAVCPSTQ